MLISAAILDYCEKNGIILINAEGLKQISNILCAYFMHKNVYYYDKFALIINKKSLHYIPIMLQIFCIDSRVNDMKILQPQLNKYARSYFISGATDCGINRRYLICKIPNCARLRHYFNPRTYTKDKREKYTVKYAVR